MYDLVIIGGGPAGLTAAVYAARKKLSTLLVTKVLGGQPILASGIQNYMGYQFIEGSELMQKFEEQVRQFAVDLRIGKEVTNLAKVEEGFEVVTQNGDKYHSRAAIIATGKRPRPLNVPGEKELIGRGVTYCAICDGPLFSGQNVAIIGSGNSALEATYDMIRTAEHVYLVSRTSLKADPVLVDKVKKASNLTILLEHDVLEVKGEDRVTAVRIRDLKTKEIKELAVGGVFVEVGLTPNSNLAKGLTNLNQLGEIEVTCANETNVPGLFAAGDVTNVPEKQIIVASGEGAKAALQAYRYLQRLSN